MMFLNIFSSSEIEDKQPTAEEKTGTDVKITMTFDSEFHSHFDFLLLCLLINQQARWYFAFYEWYASHVTTLAHGAPCYPWQINSPM